MIVTVYTLGDEHERDGIGFDLVVATSGTYKDYLDDGYFLTFEQLKDSINDLDDDEGYELSLREKYKTLTGDDSDGRWGVERLEKEIEAVNNGAVQD